MNPPRKKTLPLQEALSDAVLKQQNVIRPNTGGRSQENHRYGFRPAFVDAATGAIYESRFANGHPAPFHLLDGLPDEVVAERDASGHVTAAISSLIAGFIRRGRFHSREEAARLISSSLDVTANGRVRQANSADNGDAVLVGTDLGLWRPA